MFLFIPIILVVAVTAKSILVVELKIKRALPKAVARNLQVINSLRFQLCMRHLFSTLSNIS